MGHGSRKCQPVNEGCLKSLQFTNSISEQHPFYPLDKSLNFATMVVSIISIT